MNWLVWNKEQMRIIDFGTFEYCVAKCKELNTNYQTDAYIVTDYIARVE